MTSIITSNLMNLGVYNIFISILTTCAFLALFYKFFQWFNPKNRRRLSATFDENDNTDIRASRSPTPPNAGIRRRLYKKIPFKNIYTKMIRRRSADPPPILQRRHSTVFPLQVAKAAKDLFRGRVMYKRQMSEATREILPQPPLEFFEPSAMPEIPNDFKPMFYIQSNLALLELPANWNVNSRDIEVLIFDADEYISRPGDEDDCMYVVLEGSLAVYISPTEGKDCLVKRIEPGNNFFSLLSLIDILMRVPSVLRTVSLKAIKHSRVARYSFRRLTEAYENDPAAWSRSIKIIISRFLHVTLTPLHQHLGLSEELFKRRLEERLIDDRHRNVSGHSMKINNNRLRPKTRRLSSSDSASELFSTAIRWFSEALQISYADSHKILHNLIELEYLEEDQLVTEQGSNGTPSLIMVLHGTLKLSQEAFNSEDDTEDNSWHAFIHSKELVGGLELLSNEPSFFTLKSASSSIIVRISQENFNKLVELCPGVLLPISHSIIRRFSPFVRAVDFALDWILLDSGRAVYRQGDMDESMFVVLSGRLRSVANKIVIEEFGRGDVLGMLEMLQKKPRNSTVLAVRFSQLARVPVGLLNFVKMQFPQVGFRLVRLLGHFYNDNRRQGNFLERGLPTISPKTNEPMTQFKNIHTIAIFPASLDVPLVAFTCELYHALNDNVKAIRLSRNKVAESLGESVLDKKADFRLMHWLNSQEENNTLVIYECDYTATNWTRRCLRQADAIFVVANGDVKPPEQHFIDEYLRMNQDGLRTRKELVLLWKENIAYPTDTVKWLKGSWFSGHYHIRAPNRMFKWQTKVEKNEIEILDFYEKNVFTSRADFNGDFSRLGRILTGNAVGLVLGGGGARGAAHVGIIQALREHGIPVDIVGGTSIGSLIGGCFAEDPNQDFKARAKSWFMSMTSIWRKIWDLTYAHSAMFSGVGFNKTLQETFGEKFIEDLWLPYFCVTTDISTSEMRVHRSGLLWAYIRASMSLAGYLPPLCDPADGHLLLDGGYVNNLPADVMRSMGARCIIAVDVGAASETKLYNYGDSLSGFWVLFQRFNPWGNPVKILGMEEIQSRLAFVSCVRQLELVKKANYCHYMRPPIDAYQTLDFAKYDTISNIGYIYGRERISELVKTNSNIKAVMNPDKLRHLTRDAMRTHEDQQSLRNSFTDLAAQISRIPAKKNKKGSENDIFGETESTAEFDENDDEEMESFEGGDNYLYNDNRRPSEASTIGDDNDNLRILTPNVDDFKLKNEI